MAKRKKEEQLFNYDADDLTLISTRIPKDFHKLLRLKAQIEDIALQDLYIYIVSRFISEHEDKHIDQLMAELRANLKEVVK